jgi:hypothetical protein
MANFKTMIFHFYSISASCQNQRTLALLLKGTANHPPTISSQTSIEQTTSQHKPFERQKS